MLETDALVIGAGPVGLWQVFELGLLGLHSHVVDVLDYPGGQCMALYPDKPIYDIPGVPRCTGRELTHQLLKQIEPFAASFHFGQQVSGLERQADGRWLVSTSVGQQAGLHFLARTVFIAAGVGAFVPKELKIEGLSAFLGRQLFYQSAPPADFAGKDVVIVGGEDAAIANAVLLAQIQTDPAKSITLVHRRDVLQASEDLLSEFAALRQAGKISFSAGQVTGIQTSNTGLSGVQIATPEDQTLCLPVDTLLVCQGVSPKLGPVAHWGLAMERKQLSVSTDTFATSEAGIFAVGDVNTYPGKKKLILCGFHEATLAAFAAAALIHPEQSGVLQYTTSSALLQQRLGLGVDGMGMV